MIEDRMIDDKIALKDLLAQAVCLGVKAGRKELDYTSRGAWHIADDILNETEEILSHRERIMGFRTIAVQMVEKLNLLADEE
jgi:hypothetical protein